MAENCDKEKQNKVPSVLELERSEVARVFGTVSARWGKSETEIKERFRKIVDETIEKLIACFGMNDIYDVAASFESGLLPRDARELNKSKQIFKAKESEIRKIFEKLIMPNAIAKNFAKLTIDGIFESESGSTGAKRANRLAVAAARIRTLIDLTYDYNTKQLCRDRVKFFNAANKELAALATRFKEDEELLYQCVGFWENEEDFKDDAPFVLMKCFSLLFHHRKSAEDNAGPGAAIPDFVGVAQRIRTGEGFERGGSLGGNPFYGVALASAFMNAKGVAFEVFRSVLSQRLRLKTRDYLDKMSLEKAEKDEIVQEWLSSKGDESAICGFASFLYTTPHMSQYAGRAGLATFLTTSKQGPTIFQQYLNNLLYGETERRSSKRTRREVQVDDLSVAANKTSRAAVPDMELRLHVRDEIQGVLEKMSPDQRVVLHIMLYVLKKEVRTPDIVREHVESFLSDRPEYARVNLQPNSYKAVKRVYDELLKIQERQEWDDEERKVLVYELRRALSPDDPEMGALIEKTEK